MKRKCKVCGQTKNLEAFANAGVVKGVKYYRHKCIPCYSKSKQPRKDKIREWYREYKKQLSCEKCGISDWRVLEFDHRDRKNKTFAIGNISGRGYGKETVLKEIAKCRVLCANCHRIKTFEEGIGL